MRQRTTAPTAFTLVELLIAIGVIGLIVAIILPVFARSRAAARAATCMSNLRQVGMHTQTYLNDNHRRFPEFVYSFSPGQGNSGVIVVLVKPPPFVRDGFSHYHESILACPSDAAPVSVAVPTQPGSNAPTKQVSLSYWMNLDLMARNPRPRYHHINQPANLAYFFEGGSSLDGQGKIQGAFHGADDFANTLLKRRHSDHANVLFADWSVRPVKELTAEQIYLNGQPAGNTHPGGGPPSTPPGGGPPDTPPGGGPPSTPPGGGPPPHAGGPNK